MEDQNNVPESIPAILSSDKLLAIAEQAEKRVDALNKIKLIALRTTNIKDWTDHQGKPWLQESGATKVGRLFGISWTIVGPELETYEDGHFNYTYQGIFNLADIAIEAIGSRQSKDGFFNTRYKWDDIKKKNMPHDVPPSEIDKGDVKKAAWANCLARGITTILGIKNLTWEEIEQHTGIKREQVTSIQYTKGKDKKKPSPQPSPQPSPERQNDDKDKFIYCPKFEKKVLRKACDSCNEREGCPSWSDLDKKSSSKEDSEGNLDSIRQLYVGLGKRDFMKFLKSDAKAIPGMPQVIQDEIRAKHHEYFPGQPYPLDTAPESPAPEDKPEEEEESSSPSKHAIMLNCRRSYEDIPVKNDNGRVDVKWCKEKCRPEWKRSCIPFINYQDKQEEEKKE